MRELPDEKRRTGRSLFTPAPGSGGPAGSGAIDAGPLAQRSTASPPPPATEKAADGALGRTILGAAGRLPNSSAPLASPVEKRNSERPPDGFTQFTDDELDEMIRSASTRRGQSEQLKAMKQERDARRRARGEPLKKAIATTAVEDPAMGRVAKNLRRIADAEPDKRLGWIATIAERHAREGSR